MSPSKIQLHETLNSREYEDWYRAALEILQQEGARGITVRSLARRLNVTTGSFYSHFRSRKELLDGLLKHWESESTTRTIAVIKDLRGQPAVQVRILSEFIVRQDLGRFDRAIEVWATSDPQVAEAYSRLCHLRESFVEQLILDFGFSSVEARIRGAVLSAYLRGESVVYTGRSIEERLECLHRQLAFVLAE